MESFRKRERDPYLDNARFILVVFVVFGHLISPYKGSIEAIYWINNVMASFRMPALILITGYFAKSFNKDGYIEKITIKLFIPYLIFQFIYAIYHYVVLGNEAFSLNWFKPYMGMWFLLSLYCWNLLLFIFSRLKHPIVIAVVLSLLIGSFVEIGPTFSLMRTVVFFPFFLIGFYLNKEQLRYLKKPIFKWISVMAIMLSILWMHQFSLLEAREMLLGKFSYDTIGLSTFTGIIRRSVFYMVMALGILAFLPWVPKKRMKFTRLGQRTAYVYLLHFLIIKLLANIEVPLSVQAGWLIASPFLAIGIAVLLSSGPIVYVTKPIVEGAFVYKLKEMLNLFATRFMRNRSWLRSGKI
ncbi:acyltransferase family protein [Ornithinibacillus xuwenensis]|uniref:Acyltransferase family protein n=1 Tax=Ornithinibacillus xuwenensis TaxID=3144668 RepID=A0ABU9XIZ8_9BACI